MKHEPDDNQHCKPCEEAWPCLTVRHMTAAYVDGVEWETTEYKIAPDPDATVERVAKDLFKPTPWSCQWDEVPEARKKSYRKQARSVLDALTKGMEK